MDYRKIIPCVTMENPIEEAKFYNDSGADEVAFFDSAASRESLDKNIPIIIYNKLVYIRIMMNTSRINIIIITNHIFHTIIPFITIVILY